VILTAVNDILVSLCIFLGRELDSGGRPERLVEGIMFGSGRNTTGLRQRSLYQVRNPRGRIRSPTKGEFKGEFYEDAFSMHRYHCDAGRHRAGACFHVKGPNHPRA
jgi:hypothetical protein